MSLSDYHIPVLVNEVIENLKLQNGGIYVDCTVGGGGHSFEILKQSSNITLYCFDQDEEAIRFAKKRLIPYKNQVMFFNENFQNFRNRLALERVNKVDGILMDIGVSNHQITADNRGFSFQIDSKLDMRMNKNDLKSAYNVVNEYELDDLVRIFKEYGEERFSKRIANAIIRYREQQEIISTKDLAKIIDSVNPVKQAVLQNKTKARIFQAIRIEVNNELLILKQALNDAICLLNPGGRLAVISWHSLEDRIVKQFFVEQVGQCTCPKDLPVCMCNKQQRINIVTKKPIIPTKEEIMVNSNARSAKLRVAEKLSLKN
ncbi:MAG: 16S rRNA (cytosine(1402)-N(4))-methyltransferase RsmH [Candidatus Cloacimonetes bacterium]|jgi:16S rRNA (cytosine1402-N4)-methyltransferase|nr:16S rRNA (cytosine(1402)-N(4))-methyltransferase RsmH [Candidatus Cloacimonadota bacterium]MDD4156219.1 16S rRNA (cytosine(1402)-N(4))-methyltransferase RsmH [Candidatus Cloacimonadota bacterium]